MRIWLPLLLLTTACWLNDPTAPVRDPSRFVQTDKLAYTLERDGNGRRTQLEITYTNSLADTLYIVNCNGMVGTTLDRRKGDRWEIIWSPILDQCLSPPIVLAPGASISRTIDVWGADPGTNTRPRFPSRDLAGIYRVQIHDVVKHYDDRRAGFGDAVGEAHRTSNEFRIGDE